LGAVILGPIGGIILAIAGIAAIGYVIYRNWDTIKNFLATLWNDIFGTIKTIWNGIVSFFKEWWDKILLLPPFTLVGIVVQIVKHWGQISGTIKGVFNDVVDFLKKWWPELLLIPPFTLLGVGAIIFQHWGEISKTITGIFDNLVKWFTGLPGKIWDALGDLWNKFTTAGKNILNGMWHGVTLVMIDYMKFWIGLPGKIWDALGDLWEKFKSAGKNIVNGIWRGISDTWDGFVKWVEHAFKSSFVGKILGWLGITSPSSVFAGIGKNVVLGLQQGITNGVPLIEDAATKLAKATQFKPTSPGSFSAGGSNVPGGGPYPGTATTSIGGNPVYVNFVVNLQVAGNVVTADELKADFRTYLQRGAQQNGGLLRFLQVQP
jgi:phage-related protein